MPAPSPIFVDWPRGPSHLVSAQGLACRRPSRRRGFTLVEMLVTVVVTLLIMLSLVQMFQWVGESVADGRAMIEMAGTVRAATDRLQKDLDNLTVRVRPWPDMGSAEGYFEYFEGNQYDGATAPADTITGDLDDLVMFTAYADGTPFTGQVQGQIVNVGGRPTLICDPTSPLYNAAAGAYTTIIANAAEIIWWTRYNDANGNGVRDEGEVQTLHRRVLLIRPDIDTTADNTVTARTPAEFFNSFDLSVRRLAGGQFVTNSLSDLSMRQNRFAHTGNFPFPLNPAFLFAKTDLVWSSPPGLTSAQQGEDVILSQVLSFDVRVYDAAAERLLYNGQIVSPGEAGWINAKNANIGPGATVGVGAYVDLFYARTLNAMAQAALTPTFFAGRPQLRSGLVATPTFDTWCSIYEQDGIDQDSDGMTDEGTDGIDNDGVNGTDDVGERETSPPYPVPLRGLKVSIRSYEPDTRQIRQQSVITKFTPE